MTQCLSKIVLVTGGFDPIHSGHIEYLHSAKELGKILMHKYKRSSGDWRLKFKINHPMDTGLVTDPSSGKIIPEYHVNWLYFLNDEEELAKAQTYGALSANPTFILDFYDDFLQPAVKATDTKGKAFSL